MMEKKYFLAVDTPGKAYQGHGGNGGYSTIDKDKVDILWRSMGVEGNALKHLSSKDRRDRSGFVWYKVPPKTKGKNILTKTVLDDLLAFHRGKRIETKEYIALRPSRPGGFHEFNQGEPYNIWNEEEGRDYILFAVDGKNVRTKDLAEKVDLAYYAENENAVVKPLYWNGGEELVVHTRLIATSQDIIRVYGIPPKSLFGNSFESYDARKQPMSVERALEVFSNDATWSEEIYQGMIKNYVSESLALQQVLKRERKEKKGLFSSKKVLEVAPLYAVESLETASGKHTLCAVVRGPIQLDRWVLQEARLQPV